MANRDCNGDFFMADGVQYYRCLWDGAVITGAYNGGTCQNCSRKIDGTDIAVDRVEFAKIVTLSSGTRVQLPDV